MIRCIFLAFNGVAEAYAYAVNQGSQKNMRYGMLLNFAVYALAVSLMSQWYGVRGLLYANCVQMGMRGVLSLMIAKVNIAGLGFKVATSLPFLGLTAMGSLANFTIQYLFQ